MPFERELPFSTALRDVLPVSPHIAALVFPAVCSLCAGYGPAWDVCSLLGQCEGYGDLEARQELLAFSLTHCPPDNIHGLLAASSDLQTQVALHFLCVFNMKRRRKKPITDQYNICVCFLLTT